MSLTPHTSEVPAKAVRGRSGRGNADARRTELIEQIEAIFLDEGFSTMTVDDLCKRLRCSKSTLYTIAGSREQIIQKVTRHFFERSTAAIEEDIAQESDPAVRILRYLEGVGAAMRRNSRAFYIDMVSYEPTADIYRTNSRAAARKVQGMIEEGVRVNRFRAADAALAAQVVALMIDGVQSGTILEATGLTAGEAFAEIGQLLIHGLSLKEG
jgi:AcrR family transcriptional regulator